MVSFRANVVLASTFSEMAASSDRSPTFQIESPQSCGDGDAFATPLSRTSQSVSGIKRLRDSGRGDSDVGDEGFCDIPTSHNFELRDRMRPRFIARLDFSPTINDSISKTAPESMEIAEVQELGLFICHFSCPHIGIV